MKYKILLVLITVALWSDMSCSAEEQSKLVVVDLKAEDGPDRFGSLIVSEQATSVTVQVPVASRLQARSGTMDTRPAPDVTKLGLQVWLLKADGTVVSQLSADNAASGIGGVGVENWFVMFHFTKVPSAEITGIVFRRSGKLYCRSIATKDWKPR